MRAIALAIILAGLGIECAIKKKIDESDGKIMGFIALLFLGFLILGI